MSAVVAVIGQVRAVRDLRKKSGAGQPPGDVYAREAAVLTELGGVLGDTLNVRLFNSAASVEASPGEFVSWAVNLEPAQGGFPATNIFQAVLAPVSDLPFPDVKAS